MTTYAAISLWQPWATLCATPAPTSCGRAGHCCFAGCDPLPCGCCRRGMLNHDQRPPSMVKRFETRSYPCPAKHIGQRIAIHAAKKLIPMTTIGEWTFCPLGDTASMWHKSGRPHIVAPLGAVVATAVMSASLPIVSIDDETDHDIPVVVVDELAGDVLYIEYPFVEPGPPRHTNISDQLPYGDFTPSRWAWQLDDVEPLDEPVPWKGRQGWFTVELP